MKNSSLTGFMRAIKCFRLFTYANYLYTGKPRAIDNNEQNKGRDQRSKVRARVSKNPENLHNIQQHQIAQNWIGLGNEKTISLP